MQNKNLTTAGADVLGVLRVPVLLESYGFTGITQDAVVGDVINRRLWLLAPGDFWVPPHLRVTLEADVEPVGTVGPEGNPPTILRTGGLTAWWPVAASDATRQTVSGCFCEDTWGYGPEELPDTVGTIVELWEAYSLFRVREGGGAQVPVEALGVAAVQNTSGHTGGFDVYSRDPTLNVDDGRWAERGWIAIVDVAGPT